MNAYLNAGAIGLPVHVQDDGYVEVGESERTASGQLRTDIIARKRVWTLTCNLLTWEKYVEVRNYLNTIMTGHTTFWLDEFGGAAATDSITARVVIEKSERVQFMDSTGWQSQGRNLTLRVEEV